MSSEDLVKLRMQLDRTDSYLESEFGRGGKTKGNFYRRWEEEQQEADERFDKIEHSYFGNGRMGDRTKVMIMWRVHALIVAVASGVFGSVLTIILKGWLA